jgi:hypothetical protein
VSAIPTTIPWPVNPRLQTSGAPTFTMFGSTVDVA